MIFLKHIKTTRFYTIKNNKLFKNNINNKLYKNYQSFDNFKTRVNKYDTSCLSVDSVDRFYCNDWCITDDFVHPVTTKFILGWTLPFQWIKMNWMGGPWYNRRYVYEGIKQIRKELTYYHICDFIYYLILTSLGGNLGIRIKIC